MCFFPFFKILIFWDVRGVKGQKRSKMTKNSIRHAPYLRNHTSYDCHLWYTCVKWQDLQALFSFFQNFDFLGCYGVKVQKMVQNGKKLWPSRSISQEPYTKWLSFIVHMCKMIIFPEVFSFFQNFDFSGC